jgi:hypothetical protein
VIIQLSNAASNTLHGLALAPWLRRRGIGQIYIKEEKYCTQGSTATVKPFSI